MPLRSLCFVTTFPPDRGNLAEYGHYLTHAFAENGDVGHVHVLGNVLPNRPREEQLGPKLTVHRCWTMNDPVSIRGLVAVAKRLTPDLVQLNCGIRTWGLSRRANFMGALLPTLMKNAGLRVASTLHTIGDTVRLDQHGVDPVTKLGISLASYMYLRSNLVTVTLESMRRVLRERFHATNVAHIAHGTYGARINELPVIDRPRILTFGFWGAFKDANLLIEATDQLRKKGLDAELVLGGGAHPYFPEIYERLKQQCASKPFVRLTGYVPEDRLEALFTSASVVVLPYRTNAGASGVLNLCRSYGRPVIVSNEAGLLEQLAMEGGRALVFGDLDDLTEQLHHLLTDQALQREMGLANLEVARRMTIETQAALFVRRFEQLIDRGT
jgi:glycosyltransferase involved in cell wall biosynthesis